MEYRNRAVLITGGSSGIGLALARQLARQGSHVWIFGRDQTRLNEAMAKILPEKIDPGQKFGCSSVDVTRIDQVETGLTEAIQDFGVPDILINSAGVARPGYFEELDLEIFHEMMDINFFGTLNVTKALVPRMVERHSGAIVNISSIAGFLGVYGYTAYGASKFAVRGFSDVLRAEMKPKGIQVSVVFPPDTETPQLAYEDQFKPAETHAIAGSAKPMTAEAVAGVILRDVARGRYVILPGFDGFFYYHLIRLAGNLTYPVMDWMIAQAQKSKPKVG